MPRMRARALLIVGLGAAALAAAGCVVRGEVSDEPVMNVEAFPPIGQAEAAPLVPPLAPGEAIHSESFRVDHRGQFTYERSVRRTVGFLGAEIRVLDRDAADRLRLAPYQGVLVVGVDRDGPAARAGIARDDVLIVYAGENVRSLDQFGYLVEETPPEKTVVIEGLRDQLRQEFTVTVGGQPRITASRAVTRRLPTIDDRAHSGLYLAEVTPEVASLVGGRGLLVVDLLAGGPAFFSEVRCDDLLVEAAGKPVATVGEYRAAISAAPSSRVKLVLRRAGNPVNAELTLAKAATREREFHLPLHLVSYESGPDKRRFSLLWSLLFHSSSSHKVHGCDCESRSTESEWGLVLNLLHYKSKPEETRFSFLWLFPLSFESKG